MISDTMGFRNIIVAALITASIFATITDVCGKRGRGRSRSKSRVQIGLPITGKYRDPESDQYYNHSDVMCILYLLIVLRNLIIIIYFILGS